MLWFFKRGIPNRKHRKDIAGKKGYLKPEKLQSIARMFWLNWPAIVMESYIAQFAALKDIPSILIMSCISAFGSVFGSTGRNQRMSGTVSPRWNTIVIDAIRSLIKLRISRRSGRNKGSFLSLTFVCTFQWYSYFKPLDNNNNDICASRFENTLMAKN